MSFWELRHSLSKIAVVDSEKARSYTYGDLQDLVDIFKKKLQRFSKKTIGIILFKNNVETIVGYLGSLQSSNSVLLLSHTININLLKNMLETYKPDWLFIPRNFSFELDGYKKEVAIMNYNFVFRATADAYIFEEIYPELALLLPTSGTTGNPKVIRLSFHNLLSNAQSIAAYLKLTDNERPITTLPTGYAYGLSIINSHLVVGATILLTQDNILTQDFWRFAKENSFTSVSGVPSIYAMLLKINFENILLPSLKTLTQAGGRLSRNLTEHFYKLSDKNGWIFYMMYGQTEATARISYVPPERLNDKLNSIGIPIPGCQLSLEKNTQELVVRGENVMLGYAYKRADLAKKNECNGVLYTGDIAYKDDDGFYYISGRITRFIKLHGLRINLDDIEKLIENMFGCTTVCVGNDYKLGVFVDDAMRMSAIKNAITGELNIHPTDIIVRATNDFYLTNTEKTDYKKFTEVFEQEA